MTKHILAVIIFLFSLNTFSSTYIVKDFGAKSDTTFNSQKAFQAAIDKAYNEGGGIVVVTPGQYLISGIEIKSNIHFIIQGGATIFGSKDMMSYPSHESFDQHGNDITRRYLISLHEVENVIISGKGTIDGQGLFYLANNPTLPHWIKAKKERPNALLEVSDCKNITVRDITLTNSPNWTFHILHSEDIVIDGIKIKNSLFAPNADGIDITGSKFVRVTNCDITTCDDAIVLKTWMNGKSCEDITVTNCTLETLCAALKLGTESYADFKRITFSNCAVRAASRLFAIYIRDGATAEDITVSNIVGTTKAPLVLNRPIQLMVTKRRDYSPLGTIKNVFIDNIICKTDGRVLMTADEGGTIENVRIMNMHLEYPFIEDPVPVGQLIKSQQFPQQHQEMIKARGAIVAKNMKDLRIDNLTIDWPDEEVPQDWQIPVRIINGDFDLNFKHDYRKAKQAELSVVVGENLKGGYIDLSQVKASGDNTELMILDNSDIEIKK
jgi:hypothetical protein